jgi:hypothetical protein
VNIVAFFKSHIETEHEYANQYGAPALPMPGAIGGSDSGLRVNKQRQSCDGSAPVAPRQQARSAARQQRTLSQFYFAYDPFQESIPI